MSVEPVSPNRRAELSRCLDQVRTRVDAAARCADRRPEEVTLVAVTKFFPAGDAAVLLDLGVTDIGESRDQEAAPKIAQLWRWLGNPGRDDDDRLGPVSPRPARPRVHFIGQVQSNKAASVAGYADVVESVDRVKLVTALDRAAHIADRQLEVLIQVSLDGDTARGGVVAHAVAELADRIGDAARLRLGGVMAVAPREADPDQAFERLAEIAASLRQDHPGATTISAGMTADLEQAVRHGATHVRVGNAILGARPRPR